VTQLCKGVALPVLVYADGLPPDAAGHADQQGEVCARSGRLLVAADWFEGKVEVMTGHRVRKAVTDGSGVQPLVEGPNRSVLNVDYVIAGTGYHIDLTRLPFLPADLRGRIATISGYPSFSRIGASSVPRLYFVDAPTAASIGPSARFIAGTHIVGAKLARALASRSA
jgi:hypothetical protein